MRRAIRFAVAALSIVACGGQVAPGPDRAASGGEDAAGPMPVDASSGGSASTAPTSGQTPPAASAFPVFVGPDVDSAPPMIPGSAPPKCAPGPSGGGGGGGPDGAVSCVVVAQETCNGDDIYAVTCTCPLGECACQGPTMTSVAFAGCPVCPTASQAFALCGIPQ